MSKDNSVFEFTTQRGVTVRLTGMPPLIPQQVANSVPMPSPPTYEVEALDSIEIWEHDETTLETDEDKKAWEKYQEEKTAAETLVTERLLKAILLEAVEVDVANGAIERWKQKQELIGLEVPENEEAVMLLFKESEVFRSVEALQFVMNKVLELTGVSREEISTIKGSFPDQLESGASVDNGDES